MVGAHRVTLRDDSVLYHKVISITNAEIEFLYVFAAYIAAAAEDYGIYGNFCP